jgi:cell division protease FtsH
VVEDNRETVTRIAEALLERETLDASEIEALIEGRDLPPMPEVTEMKPDKGPKEILPLDDGKVMVGSTPRTPDPEKV